MIRRVFQWTALRLQVAFSSGVECGQPAASCSSERYFQDPLRFAGDLYPLIDSVTNDPYDHLSRDEERHLQSVPPWNFMVDEELYNFCVPLT
jgi:hypothetical protein